MADNFNITAGSGTVIGADEVTRNATTELEQVIKLSVGPDGTHDFLIGAAASFGTLSSIAFGSLTTSFASLFNSATDSYQIIKIVNKTDADLIISFNAGSTEHWIVDKYSSDILDLTANGKQVTTEIDVKLASGETATVGSVYAMGVKT